MPEISLIYCSGEQSTRLAEKKFENIVSHWPIYNRTFHQWQSQISKISDSLTLNRRTIEKGIYGNALDKTQ